MVLALSCDIGGGGAPIMVCDLPDDGGAVPKILEKAASRWAEEEEEEAGPWFGGRP
jgi:hypothetical protein